MTALPKPFITIALRFVCHLKEEARKKLHFFDNEEVTVKETDDAYNTIQSDIVKISKKKVGEEDSGTTALFTKGQDYGESWELQLWTLPQTHQQLFRYEEVGNICNLLDTACVEKGDARLSAEVHIVPVWGKTTKGVARSVEGGSEGLAKK